MTHPQPLPAGEHERASMTPVFDGAAVRREAPGTDAPPIAPGRALASGRDQEVVGLFLTGYLDTEVRRRSHESLAHEGFRWSFAPGSDRQSPLRLLSPQLRHIIGDLPALDACDISVGWADGDRRHHVAPGRATLSAYLAHPLDQTQRRAVLTAAAGLGAALRQLAEIDISQADDLALPAGPQRLARWLRSGDGPWGAGVMHDRLTARLGASRVDEILCWIDELPRERVVHGRSGLGATVLSESNAPCALLLGDEIAVGPRDFDISWVLGELLIADHLAEGRHPHEAARARALIVDCRDAVLVAHGPTKDLVAAGRMTAMRVLLELHDSAAYLDRQLTDLAARAAEIVDDAR